MKHDYVLMTAARNEEAVLEKTIRAVIAQTAKPKKWIIVSDGSTDGTDDIAARYAAQYDFIVFLRRSTVPAKRSFPSKASAIAAAYEQLRSVNYEHIGNLDADVSFAPEYCERVLERFQANPRLGIAGGIIHELVGGTFVRQQTSLNSVAGAVQMFRRECYAQIGGYVPLRFGGIDSAAEIMARMHGWQVQTFPELVVQHHRPVSSGEGAVLSTKVHHGMRHYSLGYHPVFEMLRNAYKFSERPYLIGTLLTTVGYFWAMAAGMKPELPQDAVRYLRAEQMERLRGMVFKRHTGNAETA